MRQRWAVVLAVACLGTAGWAGEEANPNPAGKWEWSVKFGEQTRGMTLTLKLDGDRLTGALLGRDGRDMPITDAGYKDGRLSFTIIRQREGRKLTAKFTGKVRGDLISGQTVFEQEGQSRRRDWQAHRAKTEAPKPKAEAPKPNVKAEAPKPKDEG